MSTPERKRKRKRTTTTKKQQLLSTPQSTLNPSLPDDLVLNIVARIPRLYYPTLSLVSKSFRSLIASPELYKVRSLLGRTESCLYICVNMYCYEDGNTWYTLCRNPDKTITNGTSSGFVFVKLPIPKPPRTEFSTLAVVGSDIYNIGLTRSYSKGSSSSVLILDFTSHMWREGPNLPVELFTATVSAAALDRKIYVSGEYGDSFKASYHVFDPKAQVWYPEKDVVAHHSKQGRCMEHHLVGLCDYHYMMSDSYCEIDNVLYAFKKQALTWYDTEIREWRNVLGLEGLPTLYNEDRVRLADYGGKMAVLWDLSYCIHTHERSVWCAEIALERRTTCEIWGNIEWLDDVLKIPDMAYVQKALAATL